MGQEPKEWTASSFSGSIFKHKGAGRVGSAPGGERHILAGTEGKDT